ncbi:hypothetical protein QJQ45_018936, partial [Haematococcus lacustris]
MVVPGETKDRQPNQCFSMAVLSDSKLAWAMQEAGFKCSSDEAAYRAILQQVGSPLSEQAVAEVLSMMAQTQHAANIQGADQMGLAGQLANIAKGGAATGADGSSQSGWHWLVVIDALKASAPALNWQRVGELLDHPTFSIPSQHGFTLLLSAYKHATGSQLPVKVVVGRLWNNHAGQLSFLRHAVNAPPELFSFELSERKLPPIEGLQGGKSPTGTPNQAWLSIDLLHILCIMVTDTNNVPVVREMVDHPLKACPEVLLIGFAAVPNEWLQLQREIVSALLPNYLASHQPNSQVVLQKLWQVNPNLLLEALIEYYAQDPAHLVRILDICQELKELAKVLEAAPLPFSLELACLAGWRQCLGLEEWAQEHLTRDGMRFATAVLAFLDNRTLPDAPPGKPRLAEESVRSLMKVLHAVRGQLPEDLALNLKKVAAQVAALHPALASYHWTTGETFPSDIEEEANSQFQKIYSEAKPIEETVAMLQAFKVSPNPREQEVFACMIHNLFEEYRFFPRYPDKELHITAMLFGSLIAHGLVSSITLGIALRCVLDALRKPPASKMYCFGLDALQQFVTASQAWPHFLSHVCSIQHLREAEPELVAKLESALHEHVKNSEGLAAPGGGVQSALGDVCPLPAGPAAGALPNQALPGQARAPGVSAPGAGRPPSAPGLEAGLGGEAGAVAGKGVGGPVSVPDERQAQQLSIELELEGRAGQVLGDEVAALSLAPSTGTGAAARQPTLAAVISTESLESAAEKEPHEKPSEKDTDRISFLINNLSEDSVATRAVELKQK